MSRIFISYRRDDAEGDAGRIADRLIHYFGVAEVFHDWQSLRGGDRWRERIDAEVGGCEMMLVVIGPQWETLTLANGTRRLHARDDIVAYEVACALGRGVRVIPLLVRRSELPVSADLPKALAPLRDMQAHRLHSDVFGSSVDRLIEDMEGRRRGRWRIPIWSWIGMALAGLVFGAVLMRIKPLPESPTTAVASAGDLRLRLQLPPSGPEDDEPRFVMKQNRPPSNLKVLLDAPVSATARPVEFLLTGVTLPLPSQEFEVDVVPQVQSARQGIPTRATMCLTRTDAAPADGLLAIVECPANDRCSVSSDNPGHFVVCGSEQPRRKSSHIEFHRSWLPTVHAQPTSLAPAVAVAVAVAAQPASDIWIIPEIETLHRRRDAGKSSAFAEIRLTSPALGESDLLSVTHVSVQVTANGRLAWIDGLPPDASAVPFDATKGLDLKFGMENLGFSGARLGRESIELVLRFLAGGSLVREVPLAFEYVALRDQRGGAVGDSTLGIRWTAQYFPGSRSDRWQVFLAGASNPQGLERAKQQFDAAGFTAQLDSRTHPLVAVIRPPWTRPVWGLNVGLLLPSGQIRFTFDDVTSAALCGRLRQLAQQPRSGVRPDTYRRSVDGVGTTKWCQRYPEREA